MVQRALVRWGIAVLPALPSVAVAQGEEIPIQPPKLVELPKHTDRVTLPLWTLAADGGENGTITLEIETFNLGAVGECISCTCPERPAVPCHKLQINVFLVEIALGAFDGDDWLRGAGDMIFGGTLTAHFDCGPEQREWFFVNELMDIASNQTVTMRKLLKTLEGCQCADTNPSLSVALLLRDSDAGDSADVTQTFLSALAEALKATASKLEEAGRTEEAAKARAAEGLVRGLTEGVEQLKETKVDTTGPEVFKGMHDVRGDDVGEATGTFGVPNSKRYDTPQP